MNRGADFIQHLDYGLRLSMEKLMRILSIGLISLVITACATPDFNYLPRSIEISKPPIGSVQVAYVGDMLLQQGKYIEHDSIYLPEKIEVSWGYDLLPGYYLKKGEDQNSETYYPGGGQDGGGVHKAALADPWIAVMAYKERNELCIITNFNALVCKPTSSFVRKKKLIVTEDSFQQTLIYSGKIGNIIHIGYREFSNNIARPAFNNDVKYDLTSSDIIGYKGARLNIINATNEKITYIILSNFNRAKR